MADVAILMPQSALYNGRVSEIANPHDALFKKIFARPAHARAELRSIVPSTVAKAIDWNTLAHEPGSFTDPALTQQHTDLLFSARVRGGRQALIYLLLEHQSTPDRYMAFRLLRYLLRVWERWREDHERARSLPLIVPVVFYHGATPWSVPLNFESLVDVPSGLGGEVRAYVPSFRYLVDDLSQVSDEELRRRAMPVLALLAAVCLRDLRHRYVLEATRPWVVQWVDAARAPEAVDDVRALFRYVYEVKETEEIRDFETFIEREVGPEAKELMMSYAQQLIQQGVEQGIQQGVEQGAIEGERKLLLGLLRQRFGNLDAETEQRIATAESWQLEAWATRVLSAATLAALLAD